MRIFEIVKENVNLREAAELYGIDVNRYGKALCPFHKALFKKFCKRDFCDEVRDFKIPEPEAVAS